jgi:hypothetical protein
MSYTFTGAMFGFLFSVSLLSLLNFLPVPLILVFYPNSDMSKSTNTVVYFDWKTVIYIYVCGQCRTSQFCRVLYVDLNLHKFCCVFYVDINSIVCFIFI